MVKVALLVVLLAGVADDAFQEASFCGKTKNAGPIFRRVGDRDGRACRARRRSAFLVELATLEIERQKLLKVLGDESA